MKYVSLALLMTFAFPLALSAEVSSRVETSIVTSSSASSFVESRVETSGNAEVRIYTVINGEVVEDVFLEGEDVVFDSKHEVAEKSEPADSEAATIPIEIDKTSVSEQELSAEVQESINADSFIQYLSTRDFFLKSWGTDYFAKENNNEKTTWSASLFSAFNRFLTHFF